MSVRISWIAPCGDSTVSNQIEKDWVRAPYRLVWGKGEKAWCDLVCAERLRMIGIITVLFMSFFTYTMVLVLRGVGPILDNGYGI